MIIPRVHVVFYKLIIQGKITLPLSNVLTTLFTFHRRLIKRIHGFAIAIF
jgi:hypothetical protein